jgi:hypothetical protein
MSDEVMIRLESERAALDPVLLANINGLGAGPTTLGRAREVARFCEDHFEAGVVNGQALPGLRAGGLAPTAAVEIRALIGAIEDANVALCGGGPKFPRAEVDRSVRELRIFFGWLGRRDPAVAREVADLRRTFVRVRTDAARLSRLSELRLLGVKYEARLRALPAFPPGLLDDAGRLVRENEGRGRGGKAALKLRLRGLVYLLRGRLSAVVEAADIAFRNHADLKREARGSQARRRATAKTAAKAPAAQPADPPSVS